MIEKIQRTICLIAMKKRRFNQIKKIDGNSCKSITILQQTEGSWDLIEKIVKNIDNPLLISFNTQIVVRNMKNTTQLRKMMNWLRFLKNLYLPNQKFGCLKGKRANKDISIQLMKTNMMKKEEKLYNLIIF